MSSLSLVIGNKNYSSWSLRPWIFMRHHELEFEEIRIPLVTDQTAAALARYPSDGKVPVLLDGELTVWDSLAILEYLSESRLDGQGWPAGQQARAVARSVSAEMHSSFPAVRNELPMNCRKQLPNLSFSDQARQEIARIQDLWTSCRKQFGSQGEWLFGHFSIADAMFAPVALRFVTYSVPLYDIPRQYVNSVLQHPGIIEWIEASELETEVIAEVELGQ